MCGGLTSAPCSSSIRIISRLPLQQASQSGVPPSILRAFTSSQTKIVTGSFIKGNFPLKYHVLLGLVDRYLMLAATALVR